MGAKASTANGEGSSPRSRTFSTGSGSDVGAVGTTGFSLLRSIPGVVSSDRQRARSLSSVPDSHSSNEAIGIPNSNAGAYDISEPVETDSSPEDHLLDSPLAANISLGRVYTAHSLPSHIWSLNGIKCPVCSKFVLPDDIECHLLMCLTKPRLSYNEDVLTEDKGECVICFEDLQQGDTIARLPCLCIYHKSYNLFGGSQTQGHNPSSGRKDSPEGRCPVLGSCIDRWFEVNRSCPEHPGD